MVAGAGLGLGELGVPVANLPVGQVELGRALGFGPDYRVQPGVVTGAGQLHIQPVGVLGAGEPHQRPPAGQALGAMAGDGVGQIHPAVALPAAAALQIPARQDHLSSNPSPFSETVAIPVGAMARGR